MTRLDIIGVKRQTQHPPPPNRPADSSPPNRIFFVFRFAKRKNIHLVWMSRDGGMVALFEEQVFCMRMSMPIYVGRKPRLVRMCLVCVAGKPVPESVYKRPDSVEENTDSAHRTCRYRHGRYGRSGGHYYSGSLHFSGSEARLPPSV